ncbi:MAG: hypothetical protein Sapg2KO_16560 [Saprospiraceae bacterium]
MDVSAINLDHFQYLYQEVDLAGESAAIVHIYSEYPDYSYAIEPSEGFTCVDDVARSIVLLTEYYQKIDPDEQILVQIKKMMQFVLHMQNENGYFNNFIWHDLSINTTYQTTVAELNWWSLRAFWALEKALPLIKADTTLQKKSTKAIERLLQNIERDLPLDNRITEQVEGLTVPTWLPQRYAGDQAAILALSLLGHYERTQDEQVLPKIEALAEGILLLQKGDAKQFPHFAFMSWKNLWHAWGNSQSYVLLKIGKTLNKPVYIEAALRELDHFYPYLLENGFAEAFWVQQTKEQSSELKRNPFPHIAYGVRPMVWAALEAYKITNEEKYLALAQELGAWFSKDNAAQIPMYDPASGRCFDGILSPSDVNQNSGAESTIECLLTLIRLQAAS